MDRDLYLIRLRALETELSHYAYGREDARGERYPAWEALARAQAALEDAIAEVEDLEDALKPHPQDESEAAHA
jgi:hypothetical protein